MTTSTEYDKTHDARTTSGIGRLLGFGELRQRGISYSRTQIWTMVRAGKFPAPIKLGPSRSAWVESEVNAWIEVRIEERNDAPGQGCGRLTNKSGLQFAWTDEIDPTGGTR